MILSAVEYAQILVFIDSKMWKTGEFAIFEELVAKYPEYRLSKKSSISMQTIKANGNKIFKEYESIAQDETKENAPGVCAELAQKYGASPLMVAKTLIEKFLEKEQAEVTKDFDKIVGDYIKDPTLIPDGQLAHEVFKAACCDFNNSPLANNICSLTGISYESKLHAHLNDLGISFKTEHQLRELKYDKTPDVILDVGVFVDTQVVKWIESKARFADESMHADYVETQYNEYYSRFGPGLVIYWFGHVDTIKSERRRFLISDGFPNNITTLFDF